MQKYIDQAVKIAYEEQEKTGMPLKPHIDLSREVGERIAKELNADEGVVEIGTLMMDCMIGKALKENKLEQHVQMSAKRAEQWLKTTDLDEKTKQNILACVNEHHGVKKFHSMESEIVCNADCYRFVSIKGFTYALRYLREMPFEGLVKLLNNKVEEKWNALTLDICKEELQSQYELIKGFLNYLK